MKIFVQMKDANQPLVHDFINAYEKGSFLCVVTEDGAKVFKYPIENIWRVIEDYSVSAQ
jgi:hypothetical protein